MIVLDPTALTSTYEGYFAWSSADYMTYLVCYAPNVNGAGRVGEWVAIPAIGERIAQTVADASLTAVGADWFTYSSDYDRLAKPVSPVAVGASRFQGRMRGVFEGTARRSFVLGPAGRVPVLRENLLLRSQEFDDGAWLKSGLQPVAADATAAPDGSMTADKLIENTNSGSHRAYQELTETNSVFTLSDFVKAAERTWVALQLSNNSTAAATVWFNLNTGTYLPVTSGIGDFTSGVATIESANNGWWRVSLTATKTAVNNVVAANTLLHNGSSTSYTGNGASGLYLWGAQLNRGALADYVKTDAAAILT